MEEHGAFLFAVVLLVIILVLAFLFGDKIMELIAKAQEQVAPTTEEKEEVLEETQYRSLEILQADPADVVIYKLFKNFDPLFLNETNVIRIIYRPFILDLKGVDYADSGPLVTNIVEGLREFSASDKAYQIGRDEQQDADGKPICDNPEYAAGIDYAGDCWNAALSASLSEGVIDTDPNPCIIYYHGDMGDGSWFRGKAKIRVGWLLDDDDESDTGKQIIYTIVTICDG